MARRSYALRACDYCDLELPGNELVAVTDRVVSGTRQGSRSYFSTRGTVGRGSSSSTYYKMIQRKLCGDCYEARAAAIRRERFMRFVGTCVVLAVVIAVVAAFIAYHPTAATTTNTAEVTISNVATDDSNATVAENDTSGLPAAPPATADKAMGESDAAPVEQADDQRGQEDRRPIPVQPSHNFTDDYARAINSVTPTALESGRAEQWEAAGRKGYVVPSSPQAYGAQTCRNIYSTIFSGREQSQSASVRWCRDGDGGDWHLGN